MADTLMHTCHLPTDHPEYKTQDYCRGCSADRVKRGGPTAAEVNHRHHASAEDFCTIPGCEVCP